MTHASIATDEQAQVPVRSADGLRNATRMNFEYLVRTLSRRTVGKKYENFVINYIWAALADDSLRPVTQQYVNRRGGNGSGVVDIRGERTIAEDPQRAFVDLYFPQLHLGVECDEGQHVRQAAADSSRTEDIRSVIDDYVELRVQIEVDDAQLAVKPESVIEQLDSIVQRIRERQTEVDSRGFSWAPLGYVPWRSATSDWQQVFESGVLRASDGYLFRHNGEIREIFGAGDGQATPSNFTTNVETDIVGHMVWCPTLARVDAHGNFHSTNSAGYVNVVFEDGADVVIGQSRAEAPDDEAVDPSERNPPSGRSVAEWTTQEKWDFGRRITFVRTTDALGRKGFKFLGVFKPAGLLKHGQQWFETFRLESDTFELPTA